MVSVEPPGRARRTMPREGAAWPKIVTAGRPDILRQGGAEAGGRGRRDALISSLGGGEATIDSTCLLPDFLGSHLGDSFDWTTDQPELYKAAACFCGNRDKETGSEY
jgi:hypothetical protein